MHPLTVAEHLGREGADDHVDVGQAVQLALENLVGAQLRVVLDQRDVLDDAGQIDRRLDAGVAATDHGDALAGEQRAVAVRTERHTAIEVVVLARDVHVPPPGAGGHHDRPRGELGAALEFDGDQTADLLGRHELGRPLQVHHVDIVLLDVFFECGGELRTLGARTRR